MARTRYTAEEISGLLRAIKIELGNGLAVVEACRKLGITEQASCRWKKE
jgi:putative transposase